ncbi:hypothetical protein [Sphingobacterium detergens]
MKDIIESLKIRFNNPFLISFVISWPFWNWPITTAFIKYNAETLHKYTGCDNFIELINHYWNWTDSLLLPGVSALGYILVGPWVKYQISKYTAEITAKEDDKLLEISGKHTVSFDVYMEAINKSNKYVNELKEVLEHEATAKNENIELKSNISNLNIQIEELSSKLEAETSNSQSLDKALTEARNDAKKWNDQYSKVNANLSNSLREVNNLRDENAVLISVFGEKKELDAEIDKLKSSLKTIITNVVNNDKIGTFSGRKLLREISMLPVSDGQLKSELSRIVEEGTKIKYRIEVLFKEGKEIGNSAYTSIMDTLSPSYPMYDMEDFGVGMNFTIELDMEEDILDFLQRLRTFYVVKDVSLLETIIPPTNG